MGTRSLADELARARSERAGAQTVTEGWKHADLHELERSLGLPARKDGEAMSQDDYHSFVSYRAFLAGADWARRQRAYHAAHEWVDFDETESAWADWASDQDFIEQKVPRPVIERAVTDYFTEPPSAQPFYHFHG